MSLIIKKNKKKVFTIKKEFWFYWFIFTADDYRHLVANTINLILLVLILGN
ncbi:hypothetical protein P20311_3731 [Pseudoalteromonas sp. BSi20311]|nr:hypothetical protein P20311_3731 [Pseudoalteromonas sp. BSi20311]